jgi:hypothetical protein
MIIRHDLALVALSVVLGPPIGGVVVFGVSLFSDVLGLGQVSLAEPVMLPITMLFSYAVGWQAALVAGVANALATRPVSSVTTRLALALPIGAVPSLLAFYQLGNALGPDTTTPLIFTTTALAAGGLASLVSVLLAERFRAPAPGAR